MWLAKRYCAALPADFDATVMTLESRDRLHVKQGRSTARVVFHSAEGPLPVYLKRHYRLPWPARLAALVDPEGHHSPGSAEWVHLERVRRLGIRVPEAVAVGERIGPWGALQSFLMIAELTGAQPLHEALPALVACQDRASFLQWKRALVVEMATIAATLHRERLFHKDLYLCHFFLDMGRLDQVGSRLTLIDLHRLGEYRFLTDRWRWKDLGQLLYSTEGVAGIGDRDRLRFWSHYCRQLAPRWPRWQLAMIRRKAERYRGHNR
jgi:heptose I phosphotransferase